MTVYEYHLELRAVQHGFLEQIYSWRQSDYLDINYIHK